MIKYLDIRAIEEPSLRSFVQGLQHIRGSDWYLEVYVVRASSCNCVLHIVQVRPKSQYVLARRVPRTLCIGCGIPQYHRDLYVHLPDGKDVQAVLNATQQRLERLWNVTSNS